MPLLALGDRLFHPRTNLGKIAHLAGGHAGSEHHCFQVAGIAIDSRMARPGMLFVAFPGERVDGHQFVDEVLAKGCAAMVRQDRLPVGGPVVAVKDALAALQTWATRHRQQASWDVVGITGSVGKTSVKEVIAAVLAAQFQVHRSYRNQNGQIGVPLTLLQAPRETEQVVLEMGISLPAEMARLVEMARPEIAVMTRLTPVHRANFSSFQDLVAEKGKLLRGPPGHPPKAVVVHEETLPQLPSMDIPVLTYGFGPNASIYGSSLDPVVATRNGGLGSRFLCHGLEGDAVPVELPVCGAAMAENALAALAVGKLLGLESRGMVQALEELQMEAPMRLEWHRAGGVTWINDAYNASPASMQAALEVLGQVPGARRRIAVLGDMLELGPEAEALHRKLARDVDRAADLCLGFGSLSRHLVDAVKTESRAFMEIEPLIHDLLETIEPGDVILLKGSRGMRLERVSAALHRSFL